MIGINLKNVDSVTELDLFDLLYLKAYLRHVIQPIYVRANLADQHKKFD